MGNTQEKEGINIIQITKSESQKLQKLGYKFGTILHKTYSRSPKYYLTEDPRALKDINKIRKESIVK